jgi:2-polyprenyl-6-methoxyphenol hydroxylase-like FAD-dependent oxidoreductase
MLPGCGLRARRRGRTIKDMIASGQAGTAVLIAGGGPAGLAAATELAWHGIGCIVIEPRPEVSHRRPRAKTTSVRTMEHLRRWGVAGRLRAAAPLPVAWSQRVTFCESLSGRRITDFDGAFGRSSRRSCARTWGARRRRTCGSATR